MLFLGLVFGGPLFIVGVIGLTVTLLYWLVEAVPLRPRSASSVPALPGVHQTALPPGVPMPGPSSCRLRGIGAALLFLGLVFGGWILAAGVIALILTLAGWMGVALMEYCEKTVEADAPGHLPTSPAADLKLLRPVCSIIMLVAAFVIQYNRPDSTCLRRGSLAGARRIGRPGRVNRVRRPSPLPSRTVHAKDIQFVDKTFHGDRRQAVRARLREGGRGDPAQHRDQGRRRQRHLQGRHRHGRQDGQRSRCRPWPPVSLPIPGADTPRTPDDDGNRDRPARLSLGGLDHVALFVPRRSRNRGHHDRGRVVVRQPRLVRWACHGR